MSAAAVSFSWEGTSVPDTHNDRRSNNLAIAPKKQVIMERCSEDDFRVCDLAIAPRTLTAVAFPPDVTYLRVEQCVFSAAVSEGDDDGVGLEDEEEAEGGWECLTDPLPAEYYGVTVHHSSAANSGSSSAGSSSASASTSSSSSSWSHWPSSVDVDYSVAAFCEKVTNVEAI